MLNRFDGYLPALFGKVFISRQKDHADAVFRSIGQGKAKGRGLFDKEIVRYLDENTSAISGYFIGSGSSAVMKIKQYLFGTVDYGVTLLAGYVYDGPDAASVVFTPGFVQTLVSII
jgi:hypothetical protein